MKMAVLGVSKEIEKEAEKTRQNILVVISEGEDSRKVFDAAVQMVKETGGKIILTALIDKNIKPPFEFNKFVANERINAEPAYVYKMMYGEQLLRPFEEVLIKEGIEYEKIIEPENTMKRIASLAEYVSPARIVIGLNELRKTTKGIFRSQRKFMEKISCPLTIIP
ncbi:MAG: hypothetical protein QW413_04595 [Nitrososphaerota archaeon]